MSMMDGQKNNSAKKGLLLSLWESCLTLPEYKILDLFLSKIDNQESDRRTATIEKKELEEAMSVDVVKMYVLKNHLQRLFTPVQFTDGEQIMAITLFEKFTISQDENGIRSLELTASESAMKCIYDYEESIESVKYKLRCTATIKNQYAYMMYLYIEDNRHRGTWNIDLDDLKMTLGCTAKSYEEYKQFNQKVLKEAYEELTKKAGCKYTYKQIKKGRTVVGIEFTAKPHEKGTSQPRNNKKRTSSQPKRTEDVKDVKEVEQPLQQESERQGELWEETVCDYGFTPSQLDAIQSVLVCIPKSQLPYIPELGALNEDVDIRRYHYMMIKTNDMRARKVDRPYNYLMKIVKQDANLK